MIRTLTWTVAALLASLSAPAYAQQNAWEAPIFGFSTPDGQVDCTGQNWSGDSDNAPLIFCSGFQGRGAEAGGMGICDRNGCRGTGLLNMPWEPATPLPHGSVLGTNDTPFRCEVYSGSVFCTKRGGGHFEVNFRGVRELNRGSPGFEW
jgi:hypothetical protein